MCFQVHKEQKGKDNSTAFEEDLALYDFVKENSHFAVKENALYNKAEEGKVC